MKKSQRYSVDAIITYQGKFVIIERLSFPLGLAFPGGGIEKGEDKTSAIIREVEEETGLVFLLSHWLPKVYNKRGRDPRWPSTSYVAVGEATGNIRNEKEKTKVLLLTKEEIVTKANDFAFDHYEIFYDYINQ